MATAEDRELVVAEFENASYPGGTPTLDTAWLGIYQVLWWYEHGLLHVCEANELRKSKAWIQRARDAEVYLAAGLAIEPDDVPGTIDRMIRLPRWTHPDGSPMQRNNPLGHGLRILVSEVLERWGSDRFRYPQEHEAKLLFPGIQMHGRSENPRIDVTAISMVGGKPRAIISCKWSIRHDRISDPTNECTAYKAAAIQQQVMDLEYFVVTNELNMTRLDKIIDQPCVDGLVHVNLDLVKQLHGGALSQMLTAARAATRLFDLAEFTNLTTTWA